MERESLIGRIRKLQALNEGRGATPEEAASAAAKVQALLFEHNLSLSDVDTGEMEQAEPYGNTDYDLGANRNTVQWKRTLLYGIAKANFCTAVMHPGTTKMTLIGKKSNIEVVIYLYLFLSREVERLAKDAARTVLSGKAVYQTSFCRGATNTIYHRLKAERQQAQTTATHASNAKGTSNALVLRNAETDLQAAILKIYGAPLRSTSTRSSIGSHEGYQSGQAAGRTISINRGVGQGSYARQLT